MRLSSVAGGLLILGGVAAIGLVALAATGTEVGLGGASTTGVLAAGTLILLGFGAGGLSLFGPLGLLPRFGRVALGVDAAGLIALGFSASANTGPDTSPLLLVLLTALAALFVGLAVTTVAFLLRPGPSRLTGILLGIGCAGVALQIATGAVLSEVLQAAFPIAFVVLGAQALLFPGPGQPRSVDSVIGR